MRPGCATVCRRFAGAVTALSLTALLCSCAARPVQPQAQRPAQVPPPLLPWQARLLALQEIHQFALNGRVAANSDTNAVTAGVRWRERDSDATIDLSGPLGLGAAHIEQRGDALSVTNAQGTVYRGPAAGEQIAATLGFEPPLSSLRYWVLGASSPDPVEQQTLDAQQRLTHLQQQGWQIDYEQYTQVQDQWLPRRLTVTNGPWRLRLVINSWQLPTKGHDL